MTSYPKKFATLHTRYKWFKLSPHDNYGHPIDGWAKSLDLVEIQGRLWVRVVPWYPECHSDQKVIFVSVDHIESWSADPSCI